MSRTLTENLNERGKVRKTIDLDPPIAKRAHTMLRRDKRRRTFTRFIEDLLDAEYARITGRAA